MGKDFLTGYCQLVTGEKDPRNLRLAFSIERVLLVEFDITETVEVTIGHLLWRRLNSEAHAKRF